MFLPVCTSHSVGGSFSPETMFRNGVPPHMTWSPVGGVPATLSKLGSGGVRFAAATFACPPAPPGGRTELVTAGPSAARVGCLMLVATRATVAAQTPDRTTRERRGRRARRSEPGVFVMGSFLMLSCRVDRGPGRRGPRGYCILRAAMILGRLQSSCPLSPEYRGEGV